MIAKGYKQTEIGIIPEDWKVKELDSVLKFGSGQDYKHLSKGNIPVYGTGGVMTFVNNYLYDGESVGIGRKGTIDKPVFLSGKFWTVDTLFFTHSFFGVLPKLIYYNFLMIPWKEYNEASGVPSLNKNTLGKIKIPLPPTLKEQEAIAKVLTDTDNLIQAIEKVIAKKKAIKKGAMQQLLSGKTRLQGYGKNKNYKQTEVGVIPEDWVIYSINDLLELLTDFDANGSFSSVAENVKVYDKENYAWYVRSTDLEKNTDISKVKYVDEQSYKFLKKSKLFGGELLFLKRGDIGNVYYFKEKTKKATLAPNLYLLKLNDISDSLYLYYFFKCNLGQKQLKSKNASSTLGALYKNDVKSIKTPLPPTKEEQEAIAIVLSDMDKEIEALEVKKEKYIQLKKGLAQELLTGKTRLV